MQDYAAKIVPAARLLIRRNEEDEHEPWSFANLRGQLIELSEEHPLGALTFASELIGSAQHDGEPVAWISACPSIFFPPDLAENGIDVSAVVVVAVKDEREALWACDLLVRSQAFGLLVVDLERGRRLADAALARLTHLARRCDAAILFLTLKKGSFSSLGSLVTLRGVVRRAGMLVPGSPKLPAPTIACEVTTVKDKRRTPGSRITRRYDGPRGVC